MSDRLTPETDGELKKLKNAGMDQAGKWIQTNFARKLERERDEARKALADWENAAAHVEADHPDEKHCGCVPVLRKLLADSKKERDEWAAMCGRYKQERDEAREDTPWHSNGETKDEWFARQREKYAALERERDELRLEAKYHDEADALRRFRERERDELREAFRELWQSADAYLPACNLKTIKRWRKLAGWEAK